MVIHSGGEEVTYEKDSRTTVHVEHRHLVVCPTGRRPLGNTRRRLQAGGEMRFALYVTISAWFDPAQVASLGGTPFWFCFALHDAS